MRYRYGPVVVLQAPGDWAAESGGGTVSADSAGATLVTDITADATGLTQLSSLTTDASGQVTFYGPDGYYGVLWVGFGDAPRTPVLPLDPIAQVVDLILSGTIDPDDITGGDDEETPPDTGTPTTGLAVTITGTDTSTVGQVTLTWEITGASELTSITAGRDGTDTTGAGPWSTGLPIDARMITFDKLQESVEYTFTVTVTAPGPATVSTTISLTIGPGVDVPTQELTWAPATVWEWADTYFPDPLGDLDGSIELAVAGLTDNNKNAAALFRGGEVRVIVSSDNWRVEADGYTTTAFTFSHATSGLFRAVVTGTTIEAFWNNISVGTTTVALLGTDSTDSVGVGVWQNATSAVSIAPATAWAGDSEPGSAPPPTPGSGTWSSGGSGWGVANGQFATARGEPVLAAATWVNMLSLDTLQPGAEYGSWTGILDVAVNGIFAGENWASAAAGAYDARWIQSAKNFHAVWTARGKTASNLHVRMAWEMNGNWFVHRVPAGQETNFKNAWIRWANIMRTYAPGVKLVWSVNKNYSPQDANNPEMARSINLWPGSSYVDVYSVDWYNVWPWKNTVSELTAQFELWDGTDPVGFEAHRQKAQSYGVPFCISEWSNGSPQYAAAGGGGGESPLFIDMFWTWCKDHGGTGSGQLKYECLFNQWDRYALFGPEATQPVTAARYASKTWG